MANKDLKVQDEDAHRRRGCGRWVALLVAFALGVGAGFGVSYYLMLEAERDDTAEVRAYEALESSNDSQDFRLFLERFPHSGYATEVRRRMEQLATMEQAWRSIARSHKVADFQAFSNRFSHPYYDALCQAKIDSLDWETTVADSTVAAFEHYMTTHPGGLFYAEATFAVQEAKKRELSDAEREMVLNTLDGFMSLIGRGDTETIIGYLPDVMDQFLEKRMATRGDVVLMVEKMFGSGTGECSFERTGEVEIKKRFMAGKPAYAVRATYSGHITRNGGSKDRTYHVRADVGEGHLVRAITINTP